ncbi:unnamed protein product [Microthlaspi erraticum]|uniref:Uncharacterized protein n=1 Tax=Microthlaspi erraticum TaxID=1685480 RepID=A0A6D2JFF3_9BRAS|nr:unnamed protein product [Microthlaspi erraticum]
MLKSVFSKYARAITGRNFSSRRNESQGLRFCSSTAHSPRNNSGMSAFSENTKPVLSLGRKFLDVGMETACVGAGTACGYVLAAAIMPDHAAPLIEDEEITRSFMKETQEFIMEHGEPEDLKKLEELRGSLVIGKL